MALHVIVDGYNLIRSSRELKAMDRQDIQLGRDALTDMLAAYKKTKGHRVTVVFDGSDATAGAPRRSQTRGVQVVFSSMGRSADDVITRMAAKEKEGALVVSSDGEVMNRCIALGAEAIRSEAFEETLCQSLYASAGGSGGAADFRGAKLGTKKKGPAKRLSKKERRHRARVAKL